MMGRRQPATGRTCGRTGGLTLQWSRRPIASAPASRCAVKAAGKKGETPGMYRHPTSPGSAASSTTLRGAPQAPDRPHEGEASPQEVGAGLRQERGPHWQRASPSGQRRPGPPWSAMPARHARHAGSAPRGGASARRGRGRARPGTRPAPAGCLGRRRARTGPRATRPLPQAVYGIQAAHGRRREG